MIRGVDDRSERKERDSTGKPPFFFQPLIVGLFCLLLIFLFFVTALMDVRRTQNTLLDVFENKGMTIIETVETIAQNKLKGLMGITNRATVSFQDLESIEAGFRMQEAILNRLIELARELDRREEGGSFTRKELAILALEAGMQTIILYDAHGRVILESAPVPKEVAPRLKLLLGGSNEIAVDLHNEERGENSPYLVGVRRKDGQGMIVLIFGHKGLQYWASRVAIQEAVEGGGWRKGVHYFAVVDLRGRLIAGAGNLRQMTTWKKTRSNVEQILMRDGRSSRILETAPKLLEVDALFRVNGRKTGIARVGLEIEEVSRLRERNQAHIFFSTGLMMIGALFAVFLFYRIQNRYLRKTQQMRERLSQAERLSSLGRLAAGVAHEIRNPLNAISMAIQRIQREFGPPEPQSKQEFSQIISVVRDEIHRLNRIIEDFVGPARVSRSTFRPEGLVDLLESVVRLAREEAGSRDIRIECQWEDPDLMVYMDPARMHQAVFNLMKNALESIPGPGTVTVIARPHGSHHAAITIRDTGVGIPAEVINLIMDFEYTTKEKGLGLGLPIAKEIIQAHGGEIRVESEPGKGTTLEVILPRKEK